MARARLVRSDASRQGLGVGECGGVVVETSGSSETTARSPSPGSSETRDRVEGDGGGSGHVE